MGKKISVITPSHDTRWLRELYLSLQAQTYKDWEWIILLNGPASANLATPEQILEEIGSGGSRIVPYFSKAAAVGTIGALKKEAFFLASGDYLAEVDHDDLLVPTCLEKVVKAFEDPKVGFVYSDTATWGKDFIPFDPAYGWEYEWLNWRDLFPDTVVAPENKLCWMKSFDPDLGSMAYIWCMPDHIRVWRKEVYEALGGHNEKLAVLDDQDIIARTYALTVMKHIPEPLYVYRIHGENSWIKKNQEIQTETVRMHGRYFKNLVMSLHMGAEVDKDLCYTENIQEFFYNFHQKSTDGAWLFVRVPDRSSYKAYSLGVKNFFTPDTFKELGDFNYKGKRYPFQCMYTGWETDRDNQSWIIAHLRVIKTPGKKYPRWPLNYY